MTRQPVRMRLTHLKIMGGGGVALLAILLSLAAALFLTAQPAQAQPGTLDNLSATGGAGQVVLTWTKKASSVGVTQHSYQFQFSTDPSAGLTTVSAQTWSEWNYIENSADIGTYTVTGLAAGRYRFQVRAHNSVGAGSRTRSPLVTVTAGGTLRPQAPTNFAAAGGVSQSVLTWSRPSGAITKYQYRAKRGGSRTLWTQVEVWKDIPSSSTLETYTVTGLLAGSWWFQLRAVNASGNGPSVTIASTAAVTAPASAPAAPTSFAAAGGAGQAVLTWSKPSGAITKYQYRAKRGGGAWNRTTHPWKDIASSSALETYTVTGLSAGSYLFRLRAVNAAGNGAHVETSSAVTVTAPPSPPGQPLTLTATAGPGAGQVTLRWRTGSGTITSYDYWYETSKVGIVGTTRPMPGSTASTRSFVVTGLVPGTKYYFKVRAKNGGGASPWQSFGEATAPAASQGGDGGGGNGGNGGGDTAPAVPASLTIGFRNDSDGIVRPGQDVELTVTAAGGAVVQKVTLQGLKLYAKKQPGTGEPTYTLLGSQAVGNPFPGESVTLAQAVKPTAHTSGGNTYTLEISVPAGTPDGEYVLTASGAGGSPMATGKLTVSSSLVEVSSVRFGPSAPRRAKAASEDTKGGGTNKQSADGYADDASLTESTTTAANGGSVEFTLSVLNPSGGQAEKSAVNSIFITTTHGTLTTSYPLTTGPSTGKGERNVPTTVKCAEGATCQIDLSGLTSGALLPAKIRVLLNAPASRAPGVATVRATVVAGGKVHQPEPVTVTFTGAAKSLSIDEPPSTVLGYDVVGKDKDGNDVADDVTKTGHKAEAGAASRDELAFMVQATDGAAGAGSVVKTPTLAVAVHDSAGMLVSKDKYQTKQSGALMNALLLDIDAPKATPLKPGEYKLTLSSATPALKAERMFTVVGDGSTLELELAPMSADTFGQTVTATATVQDASGNPVAAGTAVTFKVSDFSGGNDAVVVLDTEGAVLTNKDGVASAALTVVGAGNAVVRATTAKAGGGSLLKTAVLVSRAGAEASDADGEVSLDCLSELSGFAVWTCGGSTASALFELLSARGATAIHLWNGSVWVRYSMVDGTMVPGSRDFTVGGNDVLYISN